MVSLMKRTPSATVSRKAPVRQNGPAVRVIRVLDGWTQERLAAAVGIRPATLSEIEAEKTSAYMSTLEALAHAMHIPVAAILRQCEPAQAVDEADEAEAAA